MRQLHRSFILASALATGFALAAPLAMGLAHAQEKATIPTDPGFHADTGQINPGGTIGAPSSSTDIRKIPSHAEAVAALMATDDAVSALGADVPNSAPANVSAASTDNKGQAAPTDNKTTSPQHASGGDVTTATQGQAAIGGPMSPGASAGGGSNGPAANGAPPQAAATETTGVGNRAVDPHRPGPIGSTGQTLPAKFSARNDTLDRLPTMAWPQRLTAEERQQVFKAVMADKALEVAGAETLRPASELSTDQALNGMHPLPDSVTGIGGLKKLSFVKAKNKVLLVEPSTCIVIDEIAS
jgi:hypothetical protein